MPLCRVSCYRMTNDQVIELLRQAYNEELETVMNYMTNSFVLQGVSAEEIKESLRDDATGEELTHAQMNAERLTELGAQPQGSFEFEAEQESLQPPEDAIDVLSVINGVIEAEEGSISTYRSLIEASRDADDPVTEDMAIDILGDEEAHLSEFRSFRREYE